MCLELKLSGSTLNSFSAHVTKAIQSKTVMGSATGLAVKAIDDLRLSRHGHRGPARGVVVGVGDAPLGRGLVGHQIKPVIGPGDRAGDGIHHMSEAIASVGRVSPLSCFKQYKVENNLLHYFLI